MKRLLSLPLAAEVDGWRRWGSLRSRCSAGDPAGFFQRAWIKMLVIGALALGPGQAFGIVWEKGSTPQKEAQAEMENAGKLLYSPLKVCGGTCVALGGRWVLTSRHGTDQWGAMLLHVGFPAAGGKVHPVKRVHLPKAGDLALLELEKPVDGVVDLPLEAGLKVAGERVWLGGFGKAGPVGDVGAPGGFHGGYNRVDGERKGKWVVTMSEPGKGEAPEVVLALIDSGSPMFVETAKGWRLCGIGSSASDGANPKVGDRASYAKVGPAVAWIREVMGNEGR